MDIKKGKNFTDEKPVLVLKDVFVYYLQHAKGGVPKYKKKGVDATEREYPIQILVSRKIAKAIKKFHAKLSITQYDAEEFETNFKVAPPFTDDGDNYVVIRASANAGYLDKVTKEVKDLSAPRVVSKIREDLSEVKVGNGSQATVGLNITEFNHPEHGKGTSINLGMIVISDLIAYEGGGGGSIDDDDDFDFEADEVDDLIADDEPKAEAEEEAEEEEDDLL